MKQLGRSMIEMLGVLAIIGVLSIGGIALYRRAVNNHHANTILDDVNRFAFVIMESNRAFSTNAFIDNIEYNQTSTYNLDAFLGAGAGQFGIVVTDVPKGVCESLLPKAAVEYTVRALPDKTADNVQQLSAYGAAYTDSTDICNSTNDIVLYFGDTSKQCTSGNNTECTSNADCCNGEFCWFPNDSDCYSSGTGECKKVSAYTPSTAAAATTTAAGKTWIRSYGMNWWSAQNWCTAQGKKPVSQADIDCEDVVWSACTSDTFKAIRSVWSDYGAHWLEDYGNSCYAYNIHFSSSKVQYSLRNFLSYGGLNALCQ